MDLNSILNYKDKEHFSDHDAGSPSSIETEDTIASAPAATTQHSKYSTTILQDSLDFPSSVSPRRNLSKKRFACTNCGKAFARRSDLARHHRIHSGIRQYECDIEGCGKKFIQRSALTVHMRVHTGEKPHGCEVCQKSFSDSSSLARHRRIHSGMRPYICSDPACRRSFTRRTTLTRHELQHQTAPQDGVTHRLTASSLADFGRTSTERTSHIETSVSSNSGTSPSVVSPATDKGQADYPWFFTPPVSTPAEFSAHQLPPHSAVTSDLRSQPTSPFPHPPPPAVVAATASHAQRAFNAAKTNMLPLPSPALVTLSTPNSPPADSRPWRPIRLPPLTPSPQALSVAFLST